MDSPSRCSSAAIKTNEAGVENMSAYILKMALDGICVKADYVNAAGHTASEWIVDQTTSGETGGKDTNDENTSNTINVSVTVTDGAGVTAEGETDKYSKLTVPADVEVIDHSAYSP
jgi:hypothetical protein